MKITRPSNARSFALFSLIALVFGMMIAGTTASGATPNVPNDGTENLPPGASIETLLPNMVNPIAMAFDPAGRLFYTEKTTGNVRLYAGGTLQANPVITFSTTSDGEQGLLGIAIDPNFNTNHYIYVYYTCNCTPLENRVVRFVESGGVGSSPVTIFTSPDNTSASNHNGGNIHFAQDGKLYISIGDDGDTPANSQNVTVKNGKMHRINGDGTIPADNPVFTQTGALPSLLRDGPAQQLRLCARSLYRAQPLPRIFASENGPSCDDEMNRIEAGYNYGWRPSYPCDDPNPSRTYNTIDPLWFIPNGPCCEAPTGITVYTGSQIPQWTGHIFMATYNNSVMRHFYPSADRTTVTTTNTINGVSVGMDIETGPDGALWYIEGGGYANGTLKRIIGPGGGSTPTATTVPPTATRTATRTNTATRTATRTFTPTATPTGTFFPPSNTPTNTPGGATSTSTTASSDTPVSTATETAVATATATETATVCTIEFTDVPPENAFYPYVRCLACRDVLGGYACGGPGEPCDSNNNPYFRPGNNITRGQIAKVVSNAAGFTEDAGGQIYADVLASNPFYTWINRLSNRGFIGGYACGGPGEPCNPDNQPYFRPYNNATRGQLAKIVSNAAGYGDTVSGQIFEDVSPFNPFYVWVQRLATRGIIGGYPCGSIDGEPCNPPDNRPYFRPGANVTRGQAAKIVTNTFRGSCPLPPAGTVNVDIEVFDYHPANVTVAVGTTVRWFNYDLDYHTATSGTDGVPDGVFDSGNIRQFDSWAYTFNTPGTYSYYCRPHQYMIGTITVTP